MSILVVIVEVLITVFNFIRVVGHFVKGFLLF